MIYLASNNPRRWELFEQLAIPYQILQLRNRPGRQEDVDETPLDDEPATFYVQRLAQYRAQIAWDRAYQRAFLPRPVLAAHTVISFENHIFGKPASEEEGFRILKTLSGKTHQVLTAVAVVYKEYSESIFSCTEITFRTLDDDEICRYIEQEQETILTKIGGYELEGRAAGFIKNISGSDSGAKGLPLYETAQLLERLGIK